MDCLRSGRDGPPDIAPRPPRGCEEEEALAGLSGGPPKKSNPPRSWEGACCLRGARLAAVVLSVVLGRAGGDGL